MLRFQQERDEAGGGVALRFAAEAALERSLGTPGLRRQEAKALVLRCFDRLLSDDARCAAYEDAIDAAVLRGARTACVLGSGSLLPALLLARAGVAVCVVEPIAPLADIARACFKDNELRVAVLPTIAAAAHVWGGPPDLLISESVDDGLLGERIIPQLREARRTLAAASGLSTGATRHTTALLPCRARLSGVLVQLGFEEVRGFGLEGLGIDLRHFDALRPSGQRAAVAPGYWPVRLSGWRQPHLLLSSPFALGQINFDEATAPAAPTGAGGIGGPPSAQEVVATRDGLLNAVVYYYDLYLGPGAPLVSSAPPERADRPGSWRAGWRQAAVYLERPVYVRAGERLMLGWRVCEDSIRFDLELISPYPGPRGDEKTSLEGADMGCLQAMSTLRQAVTPPPPPPGLSPNAMVPCNSYHFCMLADTARNAAYRRAIGRAVSRFRAGCGAGGVDGRHGGCRVLDIGAGTGLLGVMAARAGATHVDAVEMHQVMAETAARTLESSGVHSFRVYGCLSTQLSVGAQQGIDGLVDAVRSGAAGMTAVIADADAGAVAAGRRLAARADIIVSETLDTSLIGEGAIHSLRHAAAELLRQARPSSALLHFANASASKLHMPPGNMW
jgi:predicted RNA methylase